MLSCQLQTVIDSSIKQLATAGSNSGTKASTTMQEDGAPPSLLKTEAISPSICPKDWRVVTISSVQSYLLCTLQVTANHNSTTVAPRSSCNPAGHLFQMRLSLYPALSSKMTHLSPTTTGKRIQATTSSPVLQSWKAFLPPDRKGLLSRRKAWSQKAAFSKLQTCVLRNFQRLLM